MQVAVAIQPLLLHFLPRHVVFLRADQGEDVVLLAVLAHERGGEAEPAAGLERSGNLKHRRGQQMHFVVNDEAPVALVEQREVRELTVLAPPVRDDLVSGNRDRADFLGVAGVFADGVRRQRGFVQQLGLPLPRRRHVGREDQSGSAHQRHARHAHDGLARAARQHDDAGPAALRAAGVKNLRRRALVIPRRERHPGQRQAAQRQGKILAADVAGEVFRGETELDERLLEPAPLGGGHHKVQRCRPRWQEGRERFLMRQLLRQRQVPRPEQQRAIVLARELETAVARGEVPHAGRHVAGQRVFRELPQRRHDAFCRLAHRAGVPDRERRDAVGVDMLWRLHQLGKPRQGIARLGVARVVHFEQHRVIALHDERVLGNVFGCARHRGGKVEVRGRGVNGGKGKGSSSRFGDFDGEGRKVRSLPHEN